MHTSFFRRSFRASVLVLFLIASVALRDLDAATSPEYQLKAAFLLNFTKFVEWPPAAFRLPDSPIAICIIGDDPFGSDLDRLVEGEAVDGHRIVVSRFAHLPEAQACQVAFFSKSAPIAEELPMGAASPVLTVGERAGFLKSGGVIELSVEDRRVRFSVSQKAAETNGLKVSSRLLNVAKTVER